MKCPKCGNENNDSAKFCRKCGAKLEVENKVSTESPEKLKTEEIKQEPNPTSAEVKANTEPKQEKKQDIKKEQKQETKKSGAKKIIITIIVILILAGLGVGGYYVYDQFFYKYDEKVEKNLDQYFETNDEKYIDKIGDIVTKYLNDEEALNKIREVSNKKVEKLIEDVNASQYDTTEESENAFSKIEKKIDKLQQSNAIEKEDVEKYSEQINNLKTSKNNYIDGLARYEEKDYDKAYSYFGKVIEEDKLYQSAQEYIEKCMGDTISIIENKYKEKTTLAENATSNEIKLKYVEAYEYLIKENSKSSIDLNDSEVYQKLIKESMSKIIEESVKIITENINNKQYDVAKTNINEVVEYILNISNNKEYEELINTSLKSITDLTITATDSLISTYNYKNAKELAQDVKIAISNVKLSNTYTKTLSDKIEEIEKLMPISLLNLTTRSKDSSISLKTASFVDADGNQYEKGIMAYCSYKESYTCTYNLKGEYKRLKAIYGVCSANASNDASAYIKIYGDDKLIYTSEAINWASLSKELDVNISGIQMLKIEIVSDDLDRYVFVGNPELYK